MFNSVYWRFELLSVTGRHFWHLGVAILGVAAICATIVIKSRHHGEDRTMGNKFNASRLFVAYCWLNQGADGG